jgi:hypothetical protein
MANLEAQAGPLAAPASLINFNVRVPVLIPLMLAGLILRLALASIHSFSIDTGTFQAWAVSLSHDGPWNFYKPDSFTDYAPGYMYVLLLIGEMDKLLHFTNAQWEYVLKLPSIVADMASAYLLYRMLDKEKAALQLAATAIYIFFPCALLVGAVWGQVDSILAFFLLLTVYFIGREKPVAGAVAYTIGFLIKPQAIAALPFLAFWIVRQHRIKFRSDSAPQVPRVLLECIVVPLALTIILVTPFFELQPWKLIHQLYQATNVSNYRVNSFWAYNFWNTGGLFKMGFKCDLAGACPDGSGGTVAATKFLGISTRFWSLALLATALVSIVVLLRNARGTGYLALGTALSTLAFYLLLTRMHERYVFPFFLPFLLACALLKSRALWAAFFATTLIHLLNLYQVFGYYYFFNDKESAGYPNFLRIPTVYNWLEGRVFSVNTPIFGNLTTLPIIGSMETIQLMSILFVTAFVALLAWTYLLAGQPGRPAGAA